MEATDQNATIDSPTSDGSPQLLNNSSRRAQSPECSKCVNRKANASRAYAAARNSQESVSRYREVHNENGQLIKINIEQRGYIEQLTQKIQALEREKSEILVFQKNDQRLYKELCERHKVAQDVIKHAQQQNSEYKDIKKRHDDMKIALNEVNQKRLALISKYKNSVELLQKENMQKRTAQKRVDEQTDQLKMAHKALTAASTLMRSVKTLLVELESTKKSKATEVKIKNVKSKIENFEAFREAEKHPNRITDEITAALLTASLELEEEDKSEAAQGASESVTEFDQPPRKKPRVSRTSRQSVESVQSSGSTRFDEFESPPNDLVPLSELDNNDTAENHSKDPLFSLGLDDLESEETPAATEAEASVPARNAHVAKPQRNAQHTFKLPNVPQSVSPARKSRAATKAGGAQRKYDLSKYIDSSPEPPERTPSPKRTRSNQRINNSSSRIKVPVLEQPKRERRRTLMSMDQSPLKTTKSSKVQSPAKRAVQHKPIAPTTEVSIQNAEEKQKLQEPREEPTKKPEKVEKRKKEMCEDMPDVDDVIARMEEKANQKREDRHRMLNQQRVGRRSTITSPTQRVPSVVPVDGGSHALPQRPMEAERPIALKPVVNHAQETLEDKDTMKEAPTEATPEEPRVLLKTTEKPRTVEVKPKSPAKSDEASDAEVKSMQPTPVSPVKPVAAPPSNEVRSSSDGESVSETDKSEPPKIATGEPEEPFKTESLPESSEPTGVKTKETPCASSENVSEAEIATAVEPQTPAEDRLESVSRTALPSPVKVAQLPKKVPTRVAEPELPRPRRIVLDLSDDAESTTEVVAVKPVPFSRKPKAKEDEEPLTAKPKPAESPACAIQESSKEPREDERNERRSVPPQEKPIPSQKQEAATTSGIMDISDTRPANPTAKSKKPEIEMSVNALINKASSVSSAPVAKQDNVFRESPLKKSRNVTKYQIKNLLGEDDLSDDDASLMIAETPLSSPRPIRTPMSPPKQAAPPARTISQLVSPKIQAPLGPQKSLFKAPEPKKTVSKTAEPKARVNKKEDYLEAFVNSLSTDSILKKMSNMCQGPPIPTILSIQAIKPLPTDGRLTGAATKIRTNTKVAPQSVPASPARMPTSPIIPIKVRKQRVVKEPVKRVVGRKRKSETENEPLEAPEKSVALETLQEAPVVPIIEPVKRGRGRPRKVAQTVDTILPISKSKPSIAATHGPAALITILQTMIDESLRKCDCAKLHAKMEPFRGSIQWSAAEFLADEAVRVLEVAEVGELKDLLLKASQNSEEDAGVVLATRETTFFEFIHQLMSFEGMQGICELIFDSLLMACRKMRHPSPALFSKLVRCLCFSFVLATKTNESSYESCYNRITSFFTDSLMSWSSEITIPAICYASTIVSGVVRDVFLNPKNKFMLNLFNLHLAEKSDYKLLAKSVAARYIGPAEHDLIRDLNRVEVRDLQNEMLKQATEQYLSGGSTKNSSFKRCCALFSLALKVGRRKVLEDLMEQCDRALVELVEGETDHVLLQKAQSLLTLSSRFVVIFGSTTLQVELTAFEDFAEQSLGSFCRKMHELSPAFDSISAALSCSMRTWLRVVQPFSTKLLSSPNVT